MKTKTITSNLILVALAVLHLSAAAASHTWSGAVNGYFSNAGNWSVGGVPTLAETNILVFPAGATRFTMTNDIGALTINSMNFQGSNYVLRGASTITFGSSLINVLCGGTSNVIESPLNLPGGFVVSVSDNRVMAFHTLAGAGYLVKFGEGEVHLRGGAANTLSGGYTVNVGTLSLQKTGGATAVASDLTIVGTTNLGQYASVRLDSSEQIAGNVNVTVHPSGLLSMNNCTNTINNLTVMSGTVWLGGLLRLNGNVYLSGTDNPFPTPDLEPQIAVDLEFIGASSTITVSNLTCDVDGNIVEYGTATAINKTGPGALALKGTANNYTGALNINQGRVIAEHSTALGTIAGNTVVAAGATLELRGGGINSSETISLTGLGVDGLGALQAFSGAHTLSGGITLSGETGISVNGSGNSLNLSGAVGGAGGIRKLGDGTLTLSGFGNNGFSGASWVAGGRLNLSKSAGVRAIGSVTVTNGAQLHFTANEQMDNAGVLSLYSAAVCNLTNRTETLGGLNLGRGITLDVGAGTLTLLGNVYVGPPYTTAGGSTTIRGSLSLGGATRRFHAPDSSLRFDCVISDGPGVGGLSLNGGGGALGFGNFHFIRTNTFNGPIAGDYAGLFAYNPQSFGTTNAGISGTNNCEIILFNDDLAVSGESLTSEQLVILYSTGTNAWNGPVFLAKTNSILRFNPWGVGDTNTLTLNGPISGPGGLVLGDNLYYAPGMTVRLTQSNSFGGTTVIAPGRLVIQHPHALGSPAQGTIITADGTLELELPNGAAVLNEPVTFDPLNYFTNSPPRLALAGAVSNSWTGPITTEVQPAHVSVPDFGGTLLLNATISGSGGIEKVGNGTLILGGTGPNTFLGEAKATGGILRLQKPDGVQAVSNLTVNFPAHLEWGGSEQIANAATLTLGDTYGLMSSHNETITHLAMINGDAALGATTGTLTLLGNIDVSGAIAVLGATTVLNPGPHRITGFPATLTVPKSIHETGGSASLFISDSYVVLESSNSFSGPLALANDARVTVRHPSALGSPSQGVFTTNWSTLVLDLPPGGVMDPEPVSFGSGVSDLGFLYLNSGKTNTWTGPMTINGTGYFIPSLQSRIIISGTVSGPGGVRGGGQGEVVLTGSGANTFNGLTTDNNGGSVRLAKPPGVPALGGNILLDLFNNVTSRVILDAPNQFSPLTEVNIGTNGIFDLNGQSATLRRLIGNGQVAGNGQLTISNPPAGFDTDYSGGFASTLIKQGAGKVTFSGAFSGDLIVEGGTFSRTCAGGAGQTVISPGAVVTSSGANFFNFGALSGSGTFHISGANNMVGGPLLPPASSTFSGSIIGTNTGATLTKLGSGNLTLTGPVSLVSTTLVVNGTLLVNTVMTNPVVVNSPGAGNFPTLGGTGTVGPVTLAGVGARIAPGATTNVPSYGTLTVASLTAGAGTSYRCEIGGTNAGVNLDQINATGIVTLSGGFAEFTAFGAGATSNRYAVVKSVSAVSGTFNGDPEGDTIIPAAGRSMVITYLTAAGKEITLIEQPGAPLANINITAINTLPNGQVMLTGTGNPGSTYFIEANTNLATTNWITLGSVSGDWNGGISFTDTNAPNFPQRFYRFRLQ